jgi:hypothetical protein
MIGGVVVIRVAGLLTTECVVAEKPEKKPAPAVASPMDY